MNKINFLDSIFKYKLIKKSEYADLEKQVVLTQKERETLKDSKNKTIDKLKNKIEQLETMCKNKDILIKKRDRETHDKQVEMNCLVEENNRLNNLLEEQKNFYTKEIENFELEIDNLKAEIKQKKKLLSRGKAK